MPKKYESKDEIKEIIARLSLKSLQKYCEIISKIVVKIYALCGMRSGSIIGRHLLSLVYHLIDSFRRSGRIPNQYSSLTLYHKFIYIIKADLPEFIGLMPRTHRIPHS